MKKKTFLKAKFIALLMGFIYTVGFIWYAEYYLSEPLYLIISTISTILALFITPLISEALLKRSSFRILGSLLGTMGIIHSLYTIAKDLTLPNYPDIPAIIMRLVVILVLAIMIRRIFNPHLDDDLNLQS